MGKVRGGVVFDRGQIFNGVSLGGLLVWARVIKEVG